MDDDRKGHQRFITPDIKRPPAQRHPYPEQLGGWGSLVLSSHGGRISPHQPRLLWQSSPIFTTQNAKSRMVLGVLTQSMLSWRETDRAPIPFFSLSTLFGSPFTIIFPSFVVVEILWFNFRPQSFFGGPLFTNPPAALASPFPFSIQAVN